MSGSFIHEYETWFLRKHGYLPEHTIDEVTSLQQRVDELESVYERCLTLFTRSVRDKTKIWPDDFAYALYGDEWDTKVLEINP